MIKIAVAALLTMSTIAFSAPAAAAIQTYTISGTGSGSLGGVGFDASPFVLTLVGDTANIAPIGPGTVALDPLVSASFVIGGSSGTLSIATRLGTAGSGTIVFFSRSGGSDLFDFFLSGPVDIGAAFGPVTGTGVFALNQFTDVATTAGALTFTSSSDVIFSGGLAGAAVPEPASWAMLIAGFGLVGAAMRRRRTTVAA
ncbi:PEPxxWA-CTERM sorting domain-containing protein [Sandarakinorhabdus sp. DWP1-3-1]|uniref:PEPxxWA-CTERM sorting domain-containing protein n=1 Tax=Sandarakinorhabdus sp. DWP1-3-1 TaxID=2804627 RepID=UPI003CE817B8